MAGKTMFSHLRETGNGKSPFKNGESPFPYGDSKDTASHFHMGIPKWKWLAANPRMEMEFKTYGSPFRYHFEKPF
jgi:hypothetical protein